MLRLRPTTAPIERWSGMAACGLRSSPHQVSDVLRLASPRRAACARDLDLERSRRCPAGCRRSLRGTTARPPASASGFDCRSETPRRFRPGRSARLTAPWRREHRREHAGRRPLTPMAVGFPLPRCGSRQGAERYPVTASHCDAGRRPLLAATKPSIPATGRGTAARGRAARRGGIVRTGHDDPGDVVRREVALA